VAEPYSKNGRDFRAFTTTVSISAQPLSAQRLFLPARSLSFPCLPCEALSRGCGAFSAYPWSRLPFATQCSPLAPALSPSLATCYGVLVSHNLPGTPLPALAIDPPGQLITCSPFQHAGLPFCTNLALPQMVPLSLPCLSICRQGRMLAV
jgi:hypothetical protein